MASFLRDSLGQEPNGRAEDAPNSTALRQGDRIRTLHDITDEKSPDGKSTTTPTEKAASARRIPDLRDEAAVRAFCEVLDVQDRRSFFVLAEAGKIGRFKPPLPSGPGGKVRSKADRATYEKARRDEMRNLVKAIGADRECAVCFEATPASNTMFFSCGHALCVGCGQRVVGRIDTDACPRCPLCRRPAGSHWKVAGVRSGRRARMPVCLGADHTAARLRDGSERGDERRTAPDAAGGIGRRATTAVGSAGGDDDYIGHEAQVAAFERHERSKAQTRRRQDVADRTSVKHARCDEAGEREAEALVASLGLGTSDAMLEARVGIGLSLRRASGTLKGGLVVGVGVDRFMVSQLFVEGHLGHHSLRDKVAVEVGAAALRSDPVVCAVVRGELVVDERGVQVTPLQPVRPKRVGGRLALGASPP